MSQSLAKYNLYDDKQPSQDIIFNAIEAKLELLLIIFVLSPTFFSKYHRGHISIQRYLFSISFLFTMY